MARFALAAYTIRIREIRSTEWLPLDSFIPGLDFADVLEAYLLNVQQPGPDLQKLLVLQGCQRTGHIVEGVVETGDYGYETDLINVETQQISYRRQTSDAEMVPFFFLAEVRSGADEGILLLQRFQQFGIRQAFADPLIEWFAQEYPDHRLHINPLAILAAWKEYFEHGAIRTVRFISFDLPASIEQAFDQGVHHEEPGYIELVMHAKRNGQVPILDRLIDAISGNRDYRKIIELPDFTYEQVKVDVRLGGHTRTIDIANPYGRVLIDITSDIKLGPNGHPTLGSVSSVARRVLEDLRRDMGAQA